MTSLPQNGLVKVASHLFGNDEMDFWRDERGDIYMTSDQIGGALEYANPIKAISNLYERNEVRLSPNSAVLKLRSTDGKTYDTRVFSEKGIYEIIRKSGQPKADQFYDWVYEVLKTIRKTGAYSVPMDERQMRVETLKAIIDHEERFAGVEQRLEQVERSTTLDHGEQERVRRSVARKVCSITQDSSIKRGYFRQLHSEIKSRWLVASYRDVLRVELDEVLRYVDAWKPRIL